MKQLTDELFRALLDYMMITDDVSFEGPERNYVMGLVDSEAHQRGFKDWIEAYHKQE